MKPIFSLIFLSTVALADVPPIIPHQGRVAVDGVVFDGTGQFKFLLFSDADFDHSNGNETPVWSNEATNPPGLAAPATPVDVAVSKGLFSVMLGDPVAGMASLPGNLDPGPGRLLFLRTWFDDGSTGWQQLAPDHLFGAVPFALVAQRAVGPVDGNIEINGFDITNVGRMWVGNRILGNQGSFAFERGILEVYQRGHGDNDGIVLYNLLGPDRALKFYIDVNEVAHIDSRDNGTGPLALNKGGGGVAIGKSQPDAQLDVGGDTAVSGDLVLGGALGLGTDPPAHPVDHASGAHLTAAGDWVSVSDVHAKENLEAVDSDEILNRLAALPIYHYNYRRDPDHVRHLGPTAQDFHAAFGLGESDTAIGTIDRDGVALAAIRALKAENDRLRREMAELVARVEDLEKTRNDR